jgi:flagellar hook-associated protein 2
MATTLGQVGSGLDINSIVSALVDAEVAPKKNSIDRRESGLKAELSAIGSLKSSLSDLNAALTDISDGSAFDLISITSPTSVDITQTGSPSIGDYAIQVNSLARSQVLASPKFESLSTEVGTGTLTLSLGTPTYLSGQSSGEYASFSVDASKTTSISIDSSNNTVSGIRDAVNAANIGITASIVLDGSQVRLLFTADDSGADTAISISTVDAGDTSGANPNTDTDGLSQLAYNFSSDTSSFVGNLTEARSSSDASFSLNGLSLTSSSNKIANLVDGLDFTLKETTSTEQTVVVKRDTSGIETKVQSFVDSYNAYQAKLDTLTDHTQAGALAGDSTARRIQSAVRAATTQPNSIAGNVYSTLSEIGIEADRYGKLNLTSATFQSALTANFEDVRELLAGVGTPSGSSIITDYTDSQGIADGLVNVIDTYINTTDGMLVSRENRIELSIDDLVDDRLAIDERILSLEERYLRQFTAMDNLVGRLQGTSDFLTGQMDALKAAANR